MCLITRFPRIKTKKDIEVYKVLRHNLRSPYQGYQYIFNVLVGSDLKTRLINGNLTDDYARDILPNEIVEQRIINKEAIYFKFMNMQDINLNFQFVDDGLHSYRDISTARSHVLYSNIICKAIIPASSYIYINYNEIVSDKLIIKERVL